MTVGRSKERKMNSKMMRNAALVKAMKEKTSKTLKELPAAAVVVVAKVKYVMVN